MKKVTVFLIVGLIAALALSLKTGNDRKKEISRLSSNEKTLMQDVKRFRVSDSLNAAKVGVLTLTVEQYRNYRAEDARIIRELGLKNRALENVTTTQSQTIIELRGRVRDSIVYVPGEIPDTLRCVSIKNKWFELDGCATDTGEFSGRFENRDSLVIVEGIEYKRFLGFLWRTRKVKSREINVVSKNPYTKITGVEHIEIVK